MSSWVIESRPSAVSLKVWFTALQSDVPDVPLAVVEDILLYLPAHQVVRVCRLVCREWKELVDSASHWRERCEREEIQPCDASRPPEDWRRFYFLAKKQRNLLKNPKADDGLQGWENVQIGGDWVTEENRTPFPDNSVTKCFSTSHRLCMKEQLIDLEKEGYSAAFMDQQRPHIKISDWYTPFPHNGGHYQIKVKLLDQEKKAICGYYPYKVFFHQGDNYLWCPMTHVFKNYGWGVRFILFTHGGMSGIRLTNSSVEICPAAERAGGRQRLWHCVGERFADVNVVDRVAHGGSGVMVWATLCEGDVLHCVRQMVVTPDTDWFSDPPGPPNTVKRHILERPFIVASLRHTCAIIMLSNQHLDMPHLYAPLDVSGSEYQICVELLDERKNPIRTFEPEKVIFSFMNSEPWCQMTHVFKDYGPGVRFIRFTHGGKDTQYWAGHYGIRVTNSSVEIYSAEGSGLTNRNLLKNPSAQSGFEGWEIVQNGGDHWLTSRNKRTFPVRKCFVTSYGLCLKQQLIDLEKEGYNAAFMDQQQPHIKISDWYAPRSDCGSEYQICVELLDEKKKPISTFEPEKVFFQQGNSEPWSQMTHIFMDYGPGVRFIRFTHGGKDTKSWKGQHGIQVTYSSVEIYPV
ncbi:F-box only protein 6 [Anabarilius grahami]|uniref:F-box only protein 6 n=1 Tax=Anabarilius grahami TaxID=495550 RepID=A0A3N0Z5J8_ANAGA|nr:F-box only protein 6 [Anabarilius grahami]